MTASAAFAADDGAADFALGDFAQARALGRESMTPAGSARACQAGLVIGSYFEHGARRVNTLHAAIEDCARAIKAGENDPAAYVGYAIGLGFEAKRLRSRVAALRAKRFFIEAVALFPDSGFTHAGLGGWHSNVVREAGIARVALGASRDDARRALTDARRLDADNIAISYEYLRFLAAGDRKDQKAAAGVAATLLAAEPENALERLLIERAAAIARALGGPQSAIDAALSATEPFGGVRGEAPELSFTPPFGSHFPPAPQ